VRHRVAGPASQARGPLAEHGAARKRLSAGGVAAAALLRGRRMNPLEVFATVAGLLNIGLLVRRSVWNYPFGLAMVTAYAWLFWQARLYSDALLQLFFFAIQLAGWWAWARAGKVAGGVPVARMTRQARIVWLVAVGGISLGWGALMAGATDAVSPYWDGAVAVASVAAQILLARRLVENWALWIAVDVAAIGLYASKGLLLTAALYGVFLLMSALGLRQWLLTLRKEAAA